MSALPPIATAKADFCTRSCLLYPQKRTSPRSTSRTMKRLNFLGAEEMMDARSPIIPALTIAGASFSGPSSLESYDHGSPAHQYLAFPGVRGKGIASRTLERPVT